MGGVVRRLAVVLCIFGAEVHAQEFAREISQFVGSNARPFLQPLVDAAQANIHAGVFSAVPATDGLHVGLQFSAMFIPVPDDRKSFKPEPFSKTVEFTYLGQQFLGDLDIAPSSFPTAVGLSKRYTFSGRLRRIRPKGLPYTGQFDFVQQNATVTVGGYEDVSTVVLVVPQVTIGSWYGAQLLIRYLPTIGVPDVGDVGAFGAGLKLSMSRYVSLPVEIDAQFMYQTLTLSADDKEYAVDSDLSSIAAQVFVSRTLPLGIVRFTPYAALGVESGTVNVNYVFADPYVGNQRLTFESAARVRFVAGLSAKVWHVRLNADYNIASMNGFSLGLGAEF
ncbi:MAG: hypothetical protein HY961_15225 [Ignavibacteriae bacterium]|nr:hypothetical protein [Ignavibacteriota bacterium]